MVTMKLNWFAGKMVRVMGKSKSHQQRTVAVSLYANVCIVFHHPGGDSTTLIYYIDSMAYSVARTCAFSLVNFINSTV